MSDIPSLQEEIDRKALETIESLVTGVETGRITEEQYRCAISALWLSTAGLASKDFLVMIELADKKYGKSARTRKFFKKGESLVKLANFHDGLVILERIATDGSRETRFSFKDEPNPTKAALERFLEIEDQLTLAGYQEL